MILEDTEHEIDAGESIAGIAFEIGHYWKTIWEHPRNKQLRAERNDPNVLARGDKVFVPEKQSRSETLATDKRYVYRLRGVPSKLHIRLILPPEDEIPEDWGKAGIEAVLATLFGARVDRPWGGVDYQLIVEDDTRLEGTTGDDGMIRAWIPPDAKVGRLVVAPGTPAERTYDLRISSLQPVTCVRGAAERLSNLGIDPGESASPEEGGIRAALQVFQISENLQVTGALDAPTQDGLLKAHGC